MSDLFEKEGVQIKGLSEKLGRGILDSSGRPSGSPANWEATRGKTSELPPPDDDEMSELVAKISNELIEL